MSKIKKKKDKVNPPKAEIWWTVYGEYGICSSFQLLRKEAIQEAVKNYTYPDQGEGWKDLKKRGFRAVKVKVIPILKKSKTKKS